MIGRISRVRRERSHAWIESGDRLIFLHSTGMAAGESFVRLKKGDRVEFGVEEVPGSTRATGVRMMPK